MTDKTQLEAIADIIEYQREIGLPDFQGAAQQILDLCQPKWIYVDDRFPDAEPHRNIEIACVSPYPDDEKSPYSIHVSTRLPVTAFEGAYAWREVVLPEPPGE